MKNIFLIIFAILWFSLSSAVAEEKNNSNKESYGWFNTASAGVNLNQISFHNWQKGGENSVSWAGKLNGKFEKKAVTYNFHTTFKLGFGQTKIENQDFKKSLDELKLESVWTKKLKTLINPYISVNIETQIAPGYKYTDDAEEKVSKFFDPGYVTESMGFGYQPITSLKTRLGIAIKETFTNQYPVPYADDPETEGIEKIKVEPGAQFTADFNWKINASTIFTSKLLAFSNMKLLSETDVKFDNYLITKISKYFNFNIEYNILYDSDQSKSVQTRQSIAFGISFMIL